MVNFQVKAWQCMIGSNDNDPSYLFPNIVHYSKSLHQVGDLCFKRHYSNVTSNSYESLDKIHVVLQKHGFIRASPQLVANQ